jgi:hypothetical protein
MRMNLLNIVILLLLDTVGGVPTVLAGSMPLRRLDEG